MRGGVRTTPLSEDVCTINIEAPDSNNPNYC